MSEARTVVMQHRMMVYKFPQLETPSLLSDIRANFGVLTPEHSSHGYWGLPLIPRGVSSGGDSFEHCQSYGLRIAVARLAVGENCYTVTMYNMNRH